MAEAPAAGPSPAASPPAHAGRRAALVGLVVAASATLIYWLTNREFDAGRGDFFYLADAFLHGRTWLDFRPGPWDVIVDGDRIYVPFAPFPAVVLLPIVAVLGPVRADMVETGVNAILAGADLGLAWMLLGRLGVDRLRDRAWLVALLGFSTAIWWVTTRGGVWHTGHLIATMLSLGCLIELWGRRRAALVGVLAGAAFLTRAPLAFAVPFYALLLIPDLPLPRPARRPDARAARGPARKSPGKSAGRSPGSSTGTSTLRDLATRVPVRAWLLLTAGAGVSVIAFLWYNAVRFGTPFESGYGLAALPDWLAARRELGLFSLAHLLPNLDFLLFHGFRLVNYAPFLRPDGLGLSILVTSPALLLAATADWQSPRVRWLAAAALVVLIPSLLYYGGGWLQYGYRYALDSIPFLFALAGLAVARSGRLAGAWKGLIAFGVAVNALGTYWAYHSNDPWI